MRWRGQERVDASAFPVRHRNGRLSLESGQADWIIQIDSAFNGDEMLSD